MQFGVHADFKVAFFSVSIEEEELRRKYVASPCLHLKYYAHSFLFWVLSETSKRLLGL